MYCFKYKMGLTSPASQVQKYVLDMKRERSPEL
jgi:hypothetical protein